MAATGVGASQLADTISTTFHWLKLRSVNHHWFIGLRQHCGSGPKRRNQDREFRPKDRTPDGKIMQKYARNDYKLPLVSRPHLARGAPRVAATLQIALPHNNTIYDTVQTVQYNKS